MVGMPSSIFRNPGEDGDKYWKHGNSDGTYGKGATFDIHKASTKAKPSIVAAVMKLVGFAAVFLPIAAGAGI